MLSQEKISFRNYDYVAIQYFTGLPNESGNAVSIPFYAFYKDIGESENGNRIFARTLVPAVEVSGLKEYFKQQEKEHRS